MFSPETSEIAKPSELLTSVRAYMNVLQSVENYIHVDMTRIFNNVLLQQTQQTDSNGEPTIGKELCLIRIVPIQFSILRKINHKLFLFFHDMKIIIIVHYILSVKHALKNQDKLIRNTGHYQMSVLSRSN